MYLSTFFFAPYLEQGEKVHHVFHRHPFVMFKDLFRISFFGITLPAFFFYLFPQFVLFFAIWVVVSMIRIMYVFFNWYHDALLSTNVSLIAVQWNGFFDRTSSRLEYQNIDGTSCEIRGFRRTIFNFGHVTIAGSTTLTLKDAVNPKKIERKVMQEQEHYMHNLHMNDSNAIKTLLTDVVRRHAETKPAPEAE